MKMVGPRHANIKAYYDYIGCGCEMCRETWEMSRKELDCVRFVNKGDWMPDILGEGTFLDAKVWDKRIANLTNSGLDAARIDGWANTMIALVTKMKTLSDKGKWS